MHIRRAVPIESNVLSELVFRSKAYWGYDELFMEACREDLLISPAFIAKELVFVGEENGVIVGMYGLDLRESPLLRDFFIEPQCIGKGYGKLLWNHLLQTARIQKITSFTLHSDPFAEPFYLRMGAKRIGEIESSVFEGRFLPLLEVDLG